MSQFRSFSSREVQAVGSRVLEDAPPALRQEFIGALYSVAEQSIPFDGGTPALDVDRDLYFDIVQSLSDEVSANPASGRRHRITRDLLAAPWPRVYDIIEGLWRKFLSADLHENYRSSVNSVLAAHNVAWDLSADGKLSRVLPSTIITPIATTFGELLDPNFAAALILATSAQNAYDARPRRDSQACSDSFDAMESVAKVRFNMPTVTLGDVMKVARGQHRIDGRVIDVLQRVEVIRHNHFGHGTTAPFALSAAEVDFVYITCMAGTLLFTRC